MVVIGAHQQVALKHIAFAVTPITCQQSRGVIFRTLHRRQSIYEFAISFWFLLVENMVFIQYLRLTRPFGGIRENEPVEISFNISAMFNI